MTQGGTVPALIPIYISSLPWFPDTPVLYVSLNELCRDTLYTTTLIRVHLYVGNTQRFAFIQDMHSTQL